MSTQPFRRPRTKRNYRLMLHLLRDVHEFLSPWQPRGLHIPTTVGGRLDHLKPGIFLGDHFTFEVFQHEDAWGC